VRKRSKVPSPTEVVLAGILLNGSFLTSGAVRKIIRWRSAEEVEGSQPDRSRSGGDSPQRLVLNKWCSEEDKAE